MTRSEFRKQIRALTGTRKVLVLKNGKRLRLRALQECCAAPRILHISPDRKKLHMFEYDEILELKPLPEVKRRRKAN